MATALNENLAAKKNDFTDISSTYYPVVYSAVFTKVGNEDDTNDICQEVFLRLFRKLEEVDNVRKWLFIALQYVVIEYCRKKRPEANVEDLFNDVALTFVNGFRDARIIIAEAIGDMRNFQNEREKALFDLIAVHNFTYEEAGKQLGMTKRQVDYRYNQITARILESLRKRGVKHIEDLGQGVPQSEFDDKYDGARKRSPRRASPSSASLRRSTRSTLSTCCFSQGPR